MIRWLEWCYFWQKKRVNGSVVVWWIATARATSIRSKTSQYQSQSVLFASFDIVIEVKP